MHHLHIHVKNCSKISVKCQLRMIEGTEWKEISSFNLEKKSLSFKITPIKIDVPKGSEEIFNFCEVELFQATDYSRNLPVLELKDTV